MNTGLWSRNPHGPWLAGRFGPAGRMVAALRAWNFLFAAARERRIARRCAI